jgi:hypothetical protein
MRADTLLIFHELENHSCRGHKVMIAAIPATVNFPALAAGGPYRCQAILQCWIIFLSYLFSIIYGKISDANMVQCQAILQPGKFLITACFFCCFCLVVPLSPAQMSEFFTVYRITKPILTDFRSINLSISCLENNNFLSMIYTRKNFITKVIAAVFFQVDIYVI